MKKLVQMKNWLTKQIDLPVDVLMDLPRITLVGQVHIYIENHRGLLVFTDKEVRLLLKHGQLLIKGQSFVIKTILPEELLLEGNIEQVMFLESEKKDTP
ncbi:sporulation protein YqfC [Bacillus cereus]|uniref:Sporulation protein YqfC n=1 Tax=Bacillus arachidis TaxID=2819290 RepID=A0ABS3P0Y7_9BACI|nr:MULTISPECIES: sporulation protein YqfC [Bacillus]PGY04606.1 sporulation protein YqfC [Bacillus cereus]MBO1626490.1 sporulation protein YqfC [Bacillus arachidis]PFE05526.1 sporulation protein YqfC [Bacillus sp. AFS023182]WIY60328.1 sporulation protein YqfC [Bacillus arachidis]SDY52201.1 sporulation protein YqfC [Bacillus sp. 166amftsu]